MGTLSDLYDVVAVNIATGQVRLMDTGRDKRNAEAYVKFAVMRRGVEEEFFSEVKAGMYSEGDQWKGSGDE